MIETLHIGSLMLSITGVLVGFACIFLGYKPFSQIPVTVTNDGRVKTPRFGEVQLKVAPGIFFAVLGTVIVVVSVTTRFDVDVTADRSKISRTL
jgi:hypothetical protein